jgi:outer membrane beta-barrel protein
MKQEIGMRVSLIVLCWIGALESTVLAQDEERVAPLLEEIWRPPLEVVQPRAVSKARALELSVAVGVIPNDAFLVYVPIGLRIAYHLSERWALELGASYQLAADTGLRDFLEESDAQLRARLRERQQLRAGIGVLFAPAYGKISLGGAVLHFDGFLSGGAGVVRTGEEPELRLRAALRPDLHLGLGLRAFLGPRWLLRLELRQHLCFRPEDDAGRGGGLGFPTEISVALGVLLGGRR